MSRHSAAWSSDTLATGRVVTSSCTDADINAQTAILTAPLGVLGIAPGQPIGFEVYAFDNYFTGAQSDYIGREGGLMVYTPGEEKFTEGLLCGLRIFVAAVPESFTSSRV